MQSFALLALAASAAASPISNLVARDVCGSAPAGSGSQTPLSQPSGVQTAEACQVLCNANGQCQSFVFGMVDGTINCMLFSVPAAQVPSQGSSNLVAFDKACTSVPAVVPTTANPTGAKQTSNTGNTNTNQGTGNTNTQTGQQQSGKQAGQQKRADPQPISQPANIKSQDDCKAQCAANPSCKAFTFGDLVCKLFAVAPAQVPNGIAPRATTPQPLSQPANIKSQDDCKKQCAANPSCKSFTFGDLICKLFSVEPAQVPNGIAPRAAAAPQPLSQPANIKSQDECKKQCAANPSCKAFTFASVCKLFAVEPAQVPNGIAPRAAPQAAAAAPQPLSQPANIKSQDECKKQCAANPSCKAFTFASVCKLFAVEPAQVPNGIAPRAAPQAAAAAPQPLSQPANIKSQDECKKQCAANPSCKAFTFGSVCKLFAVEPAQVPNGIAPRAAAAPQPLSQPANIKSQDECKKQCAANPSCKAFTFGSVCKLFAVEPAQVPNGIAPRAAAAPQPLSQPANIKSQDECKKQCAANTSCKAFTFDSVCKLFAVEPARVPNGIAPRNI